jgi:hypothetical protein
LIRLLRIFGFLLIAAGALVLLSYVFLPLRALWLAYLQLPWAVQAGIGVALFGGLLLVGSVIWERLEDLDKDRSLRDEEP